MLQFRKYTSCICTRFYSKKVKSLPDLALIQLAISVVVKGLEQSFQLQQLLISKSTCSAAQVSTTIRD